MGSKTMTGLGGYASWGLGLELAQCHLHHILLAKVSHKASLDSSQDGEIDPIFWWERLQSHIAKGYGYREGNDSSYFFPNNLLHILCARMLDVGEKPSNWML